MEEKIKVLSETIVNYSLKVKKGDRVVIVSETTNPKPLIKCLIKDISKVGGIPFVKINDDELDALLLENTDEARMQEVLKQKEFEVNNYDCFIQIRYTQNEYEERNIKSSTRTKLGKLTSKVDDIRINERRWVLLNYPSLIDAYKAGMTTDEFIKYAFDVMTVDYAKMADGIKPLKELMEKTDMVRIVAPNTDLTFSIKGIPVIPCCGTMNIPDGEIYTAPVLDSVNGKITFNTPCPYLGNIFHNVSLTFKDGKIIEAKADNDNDKLEAIFNIDEGARYVGEFSIGLNPKIKDPMGDILYDEKIIGSIHFTPGKAYQDANNGNTSSIHWDMVLVEREEYGGGALYFDDKLIRKNGKFVLPELAHLNID